MQAATKRSWDVGASKRAQAAVARHRDLLRMMFARAAVEHPWPAAAAAAASPEEAWRYLEELRAVWLRIAKQIKRDTGLHVDAWRTSGTDTRVKITVTAARGNDSIVLGTNDKRAIRPLPPCTRFFAPILDGLLFPSREAAAASAVLEGPHTVKAARPHPFANPRPATGSSTPRVLGWLLTRKSNRAAKKTELHELEAAAQLAMQSFSLPAKLVSSTELATRDADDAADVLLKIDRALARANKAARSVGSLVFLVVKQGSRLRLEPSLGLRADDGGGAGDWAYASRAVARDALAVLDDAAVPPKKLLALCARFLDDLDGDLGRKLDFIRYTDLGPLRVKSKNDFGPSTVLKPRSGRRRTSSSISR